MKKSTKATLLSAFIFPGLGHIYLKKYIPGFALVGVSVLCLYYIIAKTTEHALQILEKIENSSVPLDPAAIADLASKQSTGTESLLLNIASAAILICWIIGIIDSYRIGSMRDKSK
jgi:hypothetical protein